jgi:hypothetical protein
MAEREPTAYAISLIDPLFAVAVHLGLSHGIFLETWFLTGHMPRRADAFGLATFCLGMLTLVLAWIGYHRSVYRRPVRAFGRFVVDIGLVVLYAVLLVQYHHFTVCLFLLAMIYLLYAIWDILKAIEYRTEPSSAPPLLYRYGHETGSIMWFVIFASIYVLAGKTIIHPIVPLVLAFAATIVHRVNKVVPIWLPLGSAIGRMFLFGRNTTASAVAVEPQLSPEELVTKITPDNYHPEIESGKAVGKDVC